jgi:ketosteroid isomerase-like protein
MAEQTATSLEQQARQMFSLLDEMDTTAMAAQMTDDVQAVDEISRGWMRGHATISAYFDQLDSAVEEVQSQLDDLHVREWGDCGVVTCVIRQTYRLDGREHNITAPTSMTFRRDDGEWKIAVLHSVPLPEQEGSAA